jgi:hypothetical protein
MAAVAFLFVTERAHPSSPSFRPLSLENPAIPGISRRISVLPADASILTLISFLHSEKYPIVEMCKFFGASRSGYYDYIRRKDLPSRDAPLAEMIAECQKKHGRIHGYRYVHLWLHSPFFKHRNTT